MATYSKQRIGRRLALRHRNHRNHTSVYLRRDQERGNRRRSVAQSLAGAPEAFMNQIARIIQRSNSTDRSAMHHNSKAR